MQAQLNSNFFECRLLRVLNHEAHSAKLSKQLHEAFCTVRFYSTFLKVSGLQNGVEEIIRLDNKSRVSWIWQDASIYKNTIGHFKGFVLSKSLIPESKELDSTISMTGGSTSKLTNSTQIGITDPAALACDQKVQAIFYFSDLAMQSKEYVISYLKYRVIQRNFHFVYKASSRLGKGSFAAVFQVTLNDSSKQFAVKAFLKERLLDENQGYASFHNEIAMMRTVTHSSIVNLIEIWESSNSYYFVMPAYLGGSLMDRIILTKRYVSHPNLIREITDFHNTVLLSDSKIRDFMHSMLSALTALKQRGILHRDLKPDNILFLSNSSVHPIIIDFGLATHYRTEKYIYPKCGTPGFVAPEIINNTDANQKQDAQCDVFSLGAIFYLMLTFRPLFASKQTKETIEMNKQCKIDFNSPALSHVDAKAKGLLRRMLEANPKKRITVEEALEHGYFSNIVDEYDDDFEVPDDPQTNIGSMITTLNRRHTFDMHRINNHMLSFTRLAKTASLDSSSYLLDRGFSRKESTFLNTSLVMKAPIRVIGTRNRIISLNEVTCADGFDDTIRFEPDEKGIFASPQYLRLKGTFDAQTSCDADSPTNNRFGYNSPKVNHTSQDGSGVLKPSNTSECNTPIKSPGKYIQQENQLFISKQQHEQSQQQLGNSPLSQQQSQTLFKDENRYYDQVVRTPSKQRHNTTPNKSSFNSNNLPK